MFIEGGDEPDICEINEMELNQINNIKTLCDYLECYNNVTDRGLIEENIKRGTLCASFNVLKNTTRPLIVLLRVVIMIIVANVYERIVLNDLECVSKEERKEPECGYGGASGTMGERDKVRQEAEHTEQQTGHGVSGVLIPRGSHPNVNLLNKSSLHNSYINFEKKDKIEESEHLCNAMQEQTKYRKDHNFKIFVKSYLEIEWY
ncbi:PIR protein [Plasmodium vivax]|nr:PIR protein [Plasmodium vivax]